MNLVDLLARKDRAIRQISGGVETGIARIVGRKRRIVRFPPGSKIDLADIDQFSALLAFPTNLNWYLAAGDWRPGGMRMVLRDDLGSSESATLADVRTTFRQKWVPVQLQWPIWAGRSKALSLSLEHSSGGAVSLAIGPLLNPRGRILPLLTGHGIEVGPGLNPQVWPAEGRSVRYVEALSAEHWIRLYKKGPSPARHSLEPLWSQYVIASAERLEMAADASLDFVFSNHVFEHLVNPMGVLENWLRKLRPGGLIAGVVPDARYSFDLRQPWSTFDEITAEQVAGSFEVSRKKYEKWCRYTAPYNTPEDLVARQYSIHAHYYVPELFAKIGGSLRQRGLIGGLFLETVPNNKDFGFVFWKPELSPQKQASMRVAP